MISWRSWTTFFIVILIYVGDGVAQERTPGCLQYMKRIDAVNRHLGQLSSSPEKEAMADSIVAMTLDNKRCDRRIDRVWIGVQRARARAEQKMTRQEKVLAAISIDTLLALVRPSDSLATYLYEYKGRLLHDAQEDAEALRAYFLAIDHEAPRSAYSKALLEGYAGEAQYAMYAFQEAFCSYWRGFVGSSGRDDKQAAVFQVKMLGLMRMMLEMRQAKAQACTSVEETEGRGSMFWVVVLGFVEVLFVVLFAPLMRRAKALARRRRDRDPRRDALPERE